MIRERILHDILAGNSSVRRFHDMSLKILKLPSEIDILLVLNSSVKDYHSRTNSFFFSNLHEMDPSITLSLTVSRSKWERIRTYGYKFWNFPWNVHFYQRP